MACCWIGWTHKLFFDGYNSKGDIPQNLDVMVEEEAKIQEFKEKHIYTHILAAETDKKVFSEWVDFNANAKWENKDKMQSESEGCAGED